MLISVIQTGKFKSLLRKLARKFPLVLAEVMDLTARLEAGDNPGIRYRRVGINVYRVRLMN